MLTFSDLNADRYEFSCWTAFQDDEDVYSSFTVTKTLSNEEATSTSTRHESLGPLRLREEIDKEVMFASKMLWVDTDLALILLLSCHWNWEKLLAQWFESPSDVLASVGELGEVDEQTTPEASSSPSGASRPPKRSRSLSPGPYARKRANLVSSSSISSSSEPCGICFETILEDAVGQVGGRSVSVPCGHRFCSSCWSRYLSSEIADEGRLLVRCMAYQCRTVLFEGFIKAAAAGGVYKRWQTLLAHSFVSAQKDTLRFCPAPSCDQALHIPSPSSPTSYYPSSSPSSPSLPPPPLQSPPSPTVSCANAHTTCFTCALPGGHSPVPCGLASLWRVLLRDDARRLAAEAEARLRAEEARKHAAEVEEARRKEEEEKWRKEEEKRRKEEDERRKRELEEMLETAYWKYMHSKSCPQCGTPIEKVGGCNYMRCTRCDGSFCWGCGKKNHKNGSPTCTASGKISKAQAKAKAKAEIDRLMALPASIAENSSNKKAAAKMMEEVKDEDSCGGDRTTSGGKVEVEDGGGKKEMEALDAIPKFIDGLVEVTSLGVRRALRTGTRVTWIEAQLLQNALIELTSSAKTLRWTCAMVNLMSPGSRKQGFEVVNTDLRSSVEHLCHLVTGFFNEGSMTRDRCRAISDKTTYVKRRHESLVKDASKGFSEGTWEWAIQFEDFDLTT